MANSKNPHGYPRIFHRLLASLEDHDTFTPVKYTGLTKMQATGRRNYLSGFRTAWKHESLKRQDTLLRLKAEEAYTLAKQISSTIEPCEDGSYNFIIHPKNSATWDTLPPEETTIQKPSVSKALDDYADAPLDEYERQDLVRHQRDLIIRYWNTKHILDPEWHSLDDSERLRKIADRHFENFNIDIRPLASEAPVPLDEGTGLE